MSILDQAYFAGADLALEKYASRGRAMARQWGQEAQNYLPGSPSHTKFMGLASRAGEASFAPTSRPVDLGAIHPGGTEGPVRMVVQPQDGRAAATAVKTVPESSSFHNDHLMKRRLDMAQGGLNQSPHFAKLYGAQKLPTGEHQYTSEYVPGTSVDASASSDYMRTRIGAGRDVRKAGRNIGEQNPMALHDARGPNMIRDQRTGKIKIIDSFQLTGAPRSGAVTGRPHEAETVHRFEPSWDGASVAKLPSNVTSFTPAGVAMAANPRKYAPQDPAAYRAPTRQRAEADVAAHHALQQAHAANVPPPLPPSNSQPPPLESSAGTPPSLESRPKTIAHGIRARSISPG